MDVPSAEALGIACWLLGVLVGGGVEANIRVAIKDRFLP